MIHMLHLKTAPCSICKTEINDAFIDESNHTYIAMSMWNLIEYSDNYYDKSASLWKFKRDAPPANNFDLSVNNGDFNSELFIYKAALVRKTASVVNDTNSSVKDTTIFVPLKSLSSFWRSLEMPLINCKAHLELNWSEDWILSNFGDFAKFKITDAKLHVPIVTLSTKDNINLTKRLNDGFKRSV